MAEVAQEEQEKDMTPEDEKEFQLREQVRLRMEAQIQSELKKIKLSVIVEYNMSSNCFFNQATSECSADKLITKASVQPLQCWL